MKMVYQLEVYEAGYKDCALHVESGTPPPSFNVGEFVQLSSAGGYVNESIEGVVDRVVHFLHGTQRQFIFQTRLYLKERARKGSLKKARKV
jgi:hypothetical protein